MFKNFSRFKHEKGSWAFGISRIHAPNQFGMHLFKWTFTYHFKEKRIPMMDISDIR